MKDNKIKRSLIGVVSITRTLDKKTILHYQDGSSQVLEGEEGLRVFNYYQD